MTEDDLDFPTWRYWKGGRHHIVYDRAEFDALAPGHAANPAGPWPDDGHGDDGADAERRAEVRRLRAEGRSQQAIADGLGISRHQVQRYLH